METVIGFVIAVLVGLTGVGGGSFTTPMLVLVCGVSGAEGRQLDRYWGPSSQA